MVDMFYVNMQADSNGINMVVHYNALKNADADKEKSKFADVSDALLVVNNVCSATDRPVSYLKDIFMPPSEIYATLDLNGIPNTDRVVKTQLFSRESGVSSVKSTDIKHMPGRVSIGDISADGFPDVLMTMRFDNGTEQAHIMLNSPCRNSACGMEAKNMHRRMFTPTSNSFAKFLVDDDDDDTLLNSVFEGRLNRLNFTDFGDDYRLMGEEFGSQLYNIQDVKYAVFFDLTEDSSVDILLVTEKLLPTGESGT